MPDAIYPDSVAGPARGDNCKKRAKKNSGNLWQNHAASAVMALRTGLAAEAFFLFLFLPSSLCFPVNPSPLQPLYRGKCNSGLCASCQGKEPTMGEEVILFPIFFILIGFVIWTIFSTIRRSKTDYPITSGRWRKLHYYNSVTENQKYWITLIASLMVAYLGSKAPSYRMPLDYDAVI